MSNHKSTTTVRELLRRRSCLTANLVVFTRHIVDFLVPCNSHLPLIPLFVIRYGACRRSGRRRSAWTWPLQRKVIHDSIKLLTGDAGSGTGPLNRNVIHDTIESLNEDAGLGWALSPVLARHIATYCVCFNFLTNTRLLRRFRRHPGRLLFGGRVAAPPRKALPGPGRLLFGERVAALPGRHCPESAASRSSASSTSSSSCWAVLLRIYHRRSGR